MNDQDAILIGLFGGEGGIRTHDPGFARILLFESRAFNLSATSPHQQTKVQRVTHLNDYGNIVKIYRSVHDGLDSVMLIGITKYCI